MWDPIFSALESAFVDAPKPNQRRESRRLFHGRGHVYPGLEWCLVDDFYPVILVTLFANPGDEFIATITERVEAKNQKVPVDGRRSLVVQKRYIKPPEINWQVGQLPETVFAVREPYRFHVSLERQNTGFFLDMEPGRQWLEEVCPGKKVLNLFAYTCAFSVVGIGAGANGVVNVDMSRGALSQGRENHRLNEQSTQSVAFMPLDILKSWSRIKKSGPFDVIIIDPPSFQKGSFVASRDYQKIIRRLDSLSTEKCDVLLCLNAPELPESFLHDLMHEYASHWRFCRRLSMPPVFNDVDLDRQLKLLHYRSY